MLDFYSLSKEKIIPFILDYFTSHNGIIWECEYNSEAARIEDLRLLTESRAFEKVTKKMGILIDKFERGVYKVN